MAKTIPSFGQLYKTSLAGYKWAPELSLFVRVTSAGKFFRVELQPPTFEPDANIILSEAYSPAPAWMTQELILTYATVLNKYMGKAQPHTFYMDGDGMELPAPPAEAGTGSGPALEMSSKAQAHKPAPIDPSTMNIQGPVNAEPKVSREKVSVDNKP